MRMIGCELIDKHLRRITRVEILYSAKGHLGVGGRNDTIREWKLIHPGLREWFGE
jgi:hypothetical protein